MTGSSVVPAPVFDEPAAVPSLFYRSRLLPVALPLLARRHDLGASAAWAAATRRRLRADLIELARRIPAMLEVLAALPQLRSHGDACPANLLVPADEPDVLVAIDWSMGATAPVGDDLGQLLVGPAHDGVLAVGDLPSVRDTMTRAYAAGLADEGLDVDHDVDPLRHGRRRWSCAVRSPRCRSSALGEPITDEMARAGAPAAGADALPRRPRSVPAGLNRGVVGPTRRDVQPPRSAAQVFLPTRPSGFSPQLFWKRLTTSCVPGP